MWRTLRWLLFSCQPSGCSLCPLLLFIWLNYAYVFASVCVSVCSTAFQVPAASSSAVTGSNGPHTHTFFLSLKILLVPTLRCLLPWQKNNHNNYIFLKKEINQCIKFHLNFPSTACLHEGCANKRTNKRSKLDLKTYLVQSLKSSLHGLCSNLSRHPATTSWGMSGRWAADLRV